MRIDILCIEGILKKQPILRHLQQSNSDMLGSLCAGYLGFLGRLYPQAPLLLSCVLVTMATYISICCCDTEIY